MKHLGSALTPLLVLGGLTLGLPLHADASPECNPQVEADGSQIYGQVFDAKPIRKSPARVKALLPKQTMGAKLYVRAEKGMTPGYLQRAAVCHAASRETPSYVHDPLRVDGKIESIRVYGNGGSFVIAVTADNRGTGSEIWERAKALTTEVDISEAESKARQDL